MAFAFIDVCAENVAMMTDAFGNERFSVVEEETRRFQAVRADWRCRHPLRPPAFPAAAGYHPVRLPASPTRSL